MKSTGVILYGIGFSAQLLFSGRVLAHWVMSERAGRVLSPVSFWAMSAVASLLMMTYGVLRNDIVILSGQIIGYYIYLRNLHLQQTWIRIPSAGRWFALLAPAVALAWLELTQSHSLSHILERGQISRTLMVWGFLGQIVFTLRFVYQWFRAEQAQRSYFPIGFWTISLAGSMMVFSYAVFRRDPVLFLGQLFGLLAYSRHLYLGLRSRLSSSG
jgi:lipid-A-disaccharide synthase-like uncharacterized protein